MLAFTVTPQVIHPVGFSTVALEILSNFWILRFWFLEQAPASHG